MNREVFQSNKIILFIIIAAVYIGITIAYFQANFSIWILPLVFIAGIFIIFTSLRTKLIIEDGILRYEKLGGGNEVELKNVSEIVMREVETIVDKSNEQRPFQDQGGDVKLGSIRINNNQQHVDQERKVEKIIYILDGAGRTIFSFPANVIRFTERTRFKEAILAVNSNIQVFQ